MPIINFITANFILANDSREGIFENDLKIPICSNTYRTNFDQNFNKRDKSFTAGQDLVQLLFFFLLVFLFQFCFSFAFRKWSLFSNSTVTLKAI